MEPTLRELYPTLSEQELTHVEDTLDQYLEFILRLFDRLQASNEIIDVQLTQTEDKLKCEV